MDIAQDVCPLLEQVELPSNEINEDNTAIQKFIWLPKPETTKGDILSKCVHQDADLDIEWFKAQLAFLKGLTTDERKLLRSYTRNGDEIINEILRGNPDVRNLMRIVNKLKTPTNRFENTEVDDEGTRIQLLEGKTITTRDNLFAPTPLDSINEKNVIQLATRYTNEFRKVFEKVPVLTKPLRVFRGVDPDDEIKVFPLRGFSSTTYDPFSAHVESFANPKCCIMDIVLQPGVRALWIEPISHFDNEREVLVDSINVTTTISDTPILSTVMSVNPFSEEARVQGIPTTLNVFKCEVIPTPPGQPPKSLKVKLSEFIGRFTKRKPGGMYWPVKYYRGLTRRQNAERKRSATRRTKLSFKDPKAYVPFKSDKGVKTRRSSYSSRFHAKYPEAKSLPEIAKATGVPLATLRTVYNRGMAAWRTGHRPRASQHAWGMARVHSFVLHGKTWRTADKDLATKK